MTISDSDWRSLVNKAATLSVAPEIAKEKDLWQLVSMILYYELNKDEKHGPAKTL